MKIDIAKNDSFLLVFLEGRIDSYTCLEIEEYIENHIAPGVKFIIFDFSQVFYISSAGLRILMKYHKYAEEQGGAAAVVKMPDFVKQVFEITGFDKVFPEFDSVDDAIAKLLS